MRWCFSYSINQTKAREYDRMLGRLSLGTESGVVDVGKEIKSLSCDEMGCVKIVGPEIAWVSPPLKSWRLGFV